MDQHDANVDNAIQRVDDSRPLKDVKPVEGGLSSAIEAYIAKRFPLYASGGLDAQSSLFESGVIDSLGILDIVAFLESEFEISVGNEDVIPENFETVELLADFVNRKKSGA